jgi:hypothetical protein
MFDLRVCACAQRFLGPLLGSKYAGFLLCCEFVNYLKEEGWK